MAANGSGPIRRRFCKALEMVVTVGSWSHAQYVELLEPFRALMASQDEEDELFLIYDASTHRVACTQTHLYTDTYNDTKRGKSGRDKNLHVHVHVRVGGAVSVCMSIFVRIRENVVDVDVLEFVMVADLFSSFLPFLLCASKALFF